MVKKKKSSEDGKPTCKNAMDSSGMGVECKEEELNKKEKSLLDDEESKQKKVNVPGPLFSKSFIRFPGFLIYVFGIIYAFLGISLVT